ncbi:4388_t:CDS:2 [Paraglomus brasilianum]|uniref:Cytochrome b-c1 complex subunit 7 n=1 Tax=Paraglomus brasilianum TaxID=144538 RepID=A0A9N8WN38_9GLOM|nr:4388_t:CDS:2 [Paraglomus brasilianum]
MSTLSLYKFVAKRPFLTNLLKPVANSYANLSGYRKLGLRYDDIIMEENETVQKALKRLTVEEENSRVMRYRIAFQQSLQQTILPKEQWTKPEDDIRYLTPHINEVVAEEKEREAFDALKIIKN